MLKKLWGHKKVRFLCVGTTNAVVDFGILNLLVFTFHFPVWLGNIFSISIAVTFSYFLNHSIVFKHHHNPNLKQYIKFFLLTGVGIIIIQTLVIYITKTPYYNLLHQHILSFSSNADMKLSLNMAKVTGAILGMVLNYALYTKVIFKKPLPIEE